MEVEAWGMVTAQSEASKNKHSSDEVSPTSLTRQSFVSNYSFVKAANKSGDTSADATSVFFRSH
jgi:hypothetical protein